RFGIPQRAFLVMNISRVDAQKNQMLLLRGFAKFATEHPEAHLAIIGPETQPEYGAKLRQFVRDNLLGSRVHLLPSLKNHDRTLVDAYHACDVFVLPSLQESFGIVVLEAWSAGKPVIVSDVGGLQNLVNRGKTGFVIDPHKSCADDVLASKLDILTQ